MGYTYTKTLFSQPSSSTSKTVRKKREAKKPVPKAANPIPKPSSSVKTNVKQVLETSKQTNPATKKIPNPAAIKDRSDPESLKNISTDLFSNLKTKKKTVEAVKKPTVESQQTTEKNKIETTVGTKTKKTTTETTTKKVKEPRTRVTIASLEQESKKKPGRKRKNQENDNEKNKVTKIYQTLPILQETYKLSVVIKGHTETNIPARLKDELEDSKDLWCCAFEPDEQSNVVAVCGSYTVLFLDTVQGRYIKKYTHPEPQEIFYCMSWTTLKGDELLNEQVDEDDEGCHVLAVAGRLGSIKLLNPLQNECYRYLFGHHKAVLALAFAKTEPRWLFSLSADYTVRLWDIGSPTSKNDDSACLARFNIPTTSGTPCSLSISYDLSTLIVGCDNGDLVKFNITDENLEKFRSEVQEYRKVESSTGDKWIATGPIATVDSSYIYPNGDEWHEGYIDDVHILGQDGNEKNSLSKKIVSRGSEDMEILVWDSVKSTKADAKIYKALEWPDSAECTGLKFKVIESEDQKVLIAGDYDGQIRIYNIGDKKKSKTLSDNSKEQFPPTRILSNKMSSELIRDVCCSSDTRTIVAVDNNNTTFIWVASKI